MIQNHFRFMKCWTKFFRDFDLLDMRLQHQGTQYLEEHEKQNQLATHSEKLAIAFGILATAPGTPIRIFKNPRVCEDCHLIIKCMVGCILRKGEW